MSRLLSSWDWGGGIWQRLTKSPFLCSAFCLSSGSFIAVGLSLASAPILSRIYTPADYGTLAAFIGLITTFVGVGAWQFDQAIVVERDDDTALILTRLCFILSALTALASLVFTAIVQTLWVSTVQSRLLWLLAIPALVLLGGLNLSLESYATRQQRYRLVAGRRVIAAVLTVSVSITYGGIYGGSDGLLLGYCAGSLFPTMGYLFALRRQVICAKFPNLKQLLAVAKKHRDFPLFSLPAAYAGSLSMQMPVLALASSGHVQTLGFFNRAQQLLTTPLTLVGVSLAQVFKRRAAIDYATNGTCRPLLLKTAAFLTVVGLGPTLLLALFAPVIFQVLLGENWREAGRLAQILAPMLILRLICSPISSTLYVVGAQRLDFLLSLILLLMVCGAVWLPRYFLGAGIWIVVGFSLAYICGYSIYIVAAYKSSKPSTRFPAASFHNEHLQTSGGTRL